MGARGPKSAGELEVTPSNVTSIERPRVPASLGPEEAEEWRRIVNSQPAEWLTAGFDTLLESYCRQTVLERREARIVEHILASDEFDEAAYSRATSRLDRASRTKSSLGIRLGFAHSTSYENKKAKGKGPKKPWQFEG